MLLLSVGLTCGVICSNDGTLTIGRRISVAGHVGRVDPGDQLLDRDDRCVLRSVRSRYDREHRSGPCTVNHGDRDVVAGIDAGRHLQDAVRLLAALRRRGSRR